MSFRPVQISSSRIRSSVYGNLNRKLRKSLINAIRLNCQMRYKLLCRHGNVSSAKESAIQFLIGLRLLLLPCIFARFEPAFSGWRPAVKCARKKQLLQVYDSCSMNCIVRCSAVPSVRHVGISVNVQVIRNATVGDCLLFIAALRLDPRENGCDDGCRSELLVFAPMRTLNQMFMRLGQIRITGITPE